MLKMLIKPSQSVIPSLECWLNKKNNKLSQISINSLTKMTRIKLGNILLHSILQMNLKYKNS